jgi:acyl carrier protein
MIRYLISSISLIQASPWSFPTFQNRGGDNSRRQANAESMSDEDITTIATQAFDRYFHSSGLFGSKSDCWGRLQEVSEVGVDELACLVDFGVDGEHVLKGLEGLDELKSYWNTSEDDYSISALIKAQAVTHMQCTPSLASTLTVDEVSRGALTSLEQLFLGGETLPVPLAKDLLGLVKGEVWNMYGPTETTIWSTTHRISTEEIPIPIGRPIANTQIYILDNEMQAVPIGSMGELYIGGASVARGYLYRPELTEERFVQNPFSSDHRERLYRTGDMARYLSGGVIEFRGRSDYQIKVRGHRIELGEIENVLMTHPSIIEAVVLSTSDGAGSHSLVGYFVSDGKAETLEVDLRRYLQDVLPMYMIPSRFVHLTALPKTPNGKIDRKTLPVLGAETVRQPAKAPETELEESIARIWKEELRIPQVNVEANFFDLGGHSLLAMQIHRRIKEAISPGLALTDIFRFPTVHSLAEHIEADPAEHSPARGMERAEQRRGAMNIRVNRRHQPTENS